MSVIISGGLEDLSFFGDLIGSDQILDVAFVYDEYRKRLMHFTGNFGGFSLYWTHENINNKDDAKSKMLECVSAIRSGE